ncbi:hypothetical protein C7I85_24230 [Mesorhizobium soli]|uniref:Uncharacterized protein n=2 Tax=Pseudaminobacter soli (ex Li et al. 2025) TaxID=1295366 RepID=A0A2P7S2K6_9HYPH|nr:hypothetical protein C7I85_24230 [Mesorhizobium soli]
MQSAICVIEGKPSPHKTNRKLRDQASTAFYIDAATKAPSVYAELHAQLCDMSASSTYQLTRLRPIKKKSGQQIEYLKDAYQHYYTEGQQSRADEIWELRDRFKKLEVSVAALIGWMESGTKAERGAPPQIYL